MKDSNRHKLSSIQATTIVSSTIVGVTVLILPRLATEEGFANGFITTFIGGTLSLLIVFIICLLCRRFPNKTIIDFLPEIIGVVPAFLYCLLLNLYFIIVTGATLRTFSDALKLTLLPNTPLEIIIIVMLLTVIYFVVNGINVIAKISELFMPLILFSLGLVIILNVPDVDATNLRPVLSSEFLSYFKGLHRIIISFFGYEILIFVIPYMRKPESSPISGALGVTIPTVVYVGMVATAIGVFGAYVTRTLTYPTLILAKRIKFPGGFLERFDIFFMIFWILAAFFTIGAYYYMASVTITRIFKLRNYKPFMLIILPWIYMITILPQNIFQIDQVLLVSGVLGTTVVMSMVLFYLVAAIRKKGDYKR